MENNINDTERNNNVNFLIKTSPLFRKNSEQTSIKNLKLKVENLYDLSLFYYRDLY